MLERRHQAAELHVHPDRQRVGHRQRAVIVSALFDRLPIAC
jgi:hypothetical protein